MSSDAAAVTEEEAPPDGREGEASSQLSASDSSVASMVGSAASWIQDALGVWARDDYAGVAVLVPLAVEHLGTAVL